MLICLAYGSPLTEPPQRLDEMPRRRPAPFEPIGPDEEEEYDGIVPAACGCAARHRIPSQGPILGHIRELPEESLLADA
jgi:hypothetical protein